MRFLLSILMTVSFVCASVGADALAPVVRKGDVILFIGNSFTYANDLPSVFRAMASKARVRVETKMIAKGGALLETHWTDEATKTAVTKGKCKFVVLQDQSQTPMFNPQSTMLSGANFCGLIRGSGGVPVLFETWGYLEDGRFDGEMQSALSATYEKLALQENAVLAPVGKVWREWYRQYPDTRLHSEDGRHPNEYGTYLTACVFYAVLFGKSPAGLPGRLLVDGRRVSNVPSDIAFKMQKIVSGVCGTVK